MEDNWTASKTKNHIYFNGQLIATHDQADYVRMIFKDHLGSTQSVVRVTPVFPWGETWETMEGYDYYPYGDQYSFWSTDPDNTDERFTSQKHDGSSLNYFGARYYFAPLTWVWADNPRWISADKFNSDLPTPRRLTKYAYCMGDPVNFVDPNGEDPYSISVTVWGRRSTNPDLWISGMLPGPGQCTSVYLDGMYIGNTCAQRGVERGGGKEGIPGAFERFFEAVDSALRKNPGTAETWFDCATSIINVIDATVTNFTPVVGLWADALAGIQSSLQLLKDGQMSAEAFGGVFVFVNWLAATMSNVASYILSTASPAMPPLEPLRWMLGAGTSWVELIILNESAPKAVSPINFTRKEIGEQPTAAAMLGAAVATVLPDQFSNLANQVANACGAQKKK